METFEEHYASMRRCILAHNPLTDMALIDRAVDYAAQKHRNQKRKDGSPYIIHPLAVAESLAQHGVRHHHKRRCSHAAALQKVSSRNLLHLFLVLVLFYAPDGRPAPPGGVVSPKLAVLIHTSPHFVEKKSSLPHFPHASPQEKPVA